MHVLRNWIVLPKVQAMDDYPNFQDVPNESVVIFVCATTGQWDQLSGLKCAVIGLGDSGYAQFKFAAKPLDKGLRLLKVS